MDISEQYIIDNTMSSTFAQIANTDRKRHIYANPAKQSEIQSFLHLKYGRSKGDIVSGEAAILVQKFNSTNIWSVHERDKAIGLIGFVQLNNLGLYHYLNGTLEMNEPNTACLARTETSASATVFWFFSGKTRSVYGLVDVMTWLHASKNRQLDIWAGSVTGQEQAFLKSIGFQSYDHIFPGLLRFKRAKASLRH